MKGMNKYYMKIKSFLIFLLQLSFICSCANNLSNEENDKMKIYYKYDQRFRRIQADEIKNNIEQGFPYEIFQIETISKEYRAFAKEKLEYLKQFINKNINSVREILYHNGEQVPLINLKEYNEKYKKEYNNFQTFKIKLKNILGEHKNCIRVIMSNDYVIMTVEYITLSDNLTTDLKCYDETPFCQPWWSNYYFAQKMGTSNKVKLDDGSFFDRSLNQDYWFYESNLKLCVVHKIKDDKGNYYGELRLDFYKLDDYEKLFDAKGNPKK